MSFLSSSKDYGDGESSAIKQAYGYAIGYRQLGCWASNHFVSRSFFSLSNLISSKIYSATDFLPSVSALYFAQAHSSSSSINRFVRTFPFTIISAIASIYITSPTFTTQTTHINTTVDTTQVAITNGKLQDMWKTVKRSKVNTQRNWARMLREAWPRASCSNRSRPILHGAQQFRDQRQMDVRVDRLRA